MEGSVTASGSITLTVNRPRVVKAPLGWRLRNGLRKLLSGELLIPAWVWLCRRLGPRGVVYATAELRGRVRKADGTVVDYGVLGRHLITTAGKNFLAGAFNNSTELENLRFHGFGSGATAAAAGDTALQSEYTTQYATDNTRPTGSQSVTTNVYTTAATFAPDSGGTLAVTEWGLFSSATVGAGTLLDRQVFSPVNLTAGTDSLAITYNFTQN